MRPWIQPNLFVPCLLAAEEVQRRPDLRLTDDEGHEDGASIVLVPLLPP
jgi:hypothetical protein